jgi:hypothetical protein
VRCLLVVQKALATVDGCMGSPDRAGCTAVANGILSRGLLNGVVEFHNLAMDMIARIGRRSVRVSHSA